MRRPSRVTVMECQAKSFDIWDRRKGIRRFALTRRQIMIDKLPFVFLAFVTTPVTASPVFARPFHHGRIVARHTHQQSVLRSERRTSFPDSNGPALTGGGSLGYNQMLLID